MIKRPNNKYNNKITKIKYMVIGIVIPMVLLYVFISIYYNYHFYNNATINHIDISNMTIKQAEDAIKNHLKTYELTIEGRNGIVDTITGKYIGLYPVTGKNIKKILKKQRGFTWPIDVFKGHHEELYSFIFYDDSLLMKHLKDLKHLKEKNVIEPVDAHISEYGNKGFEIIKEDHGAKIDNVKLKKEIKKSITRLEPTLSLEDTRCYVEPKIYSDDTKLLRALEEINRIAGAKITYEFGEITEVLDGYQISEWLSVNEDLKVVLDPVGVKEYVDYIGKYYNTFGKERTFKTTYGEVIKVKGGDYGWWLNRPAEVVELTELLIKGEQTVREPAYYQTAKQYGDDDIGDTYVEVNLTAQHLFFYKDGILIMDSDFVSGNVSRNYGTPTGTYPVQYKQRDTTLDGEDYSAPVKYWMPFNGNIGFHDASWRRSFGRKIYRTSGSHGCINMPEASAKKMYEHIERGVAVVVYELEGTESFYEQNIENMVENVPEE